MRPYTAGCGLHTERPYEMLRTAILDERVLCYYVPALERELIQLEGPRKIDHPSSDGASKAIRLSGGLRLSLRREMAGRRARQLALTIANFDLSATNPVG